MGKPRPKPSHRLCCPTWSEQVTRWEMPVLGELWLEVWKVLLRASSNYNRYQKQLKSLEIIYVRTHVCCTCWESLEMSKRANCSHPKHWSTQQKSCKFLGCQMWSDRWAVLNLHEALCVKLFWFWFWCFIGMGRAWTMTNSQSVSTTTVNSEQHFIIHDMTRHDDMPTDMIIKIMIHDS